MIKTPGDIKGTFAILPAGPTTTLVSTLVLIAISNTRLMLFFTVATQRRSINRRGKILGSYNYQASQKQPENAKPSQKPEPVNSGHGYPPRLSGCHRSEQREYKFMVNPPL
jgi:hypothetical protein